MELYDLSGTFANNSEDKPQSLTTIVIGYSLGGGHVTVFQQRDQTAAAYHGEHPRLPLARLAAQDLQQSAWGRCTTATPPPSRPARFCTRWGIVGRHRRAAGAGGSGSSSSATRVMSASLGMRGRTSTRYLQRGQGQTRPIRGNGARNLALQPGQRKERCRVMGAPWGAKAVRHWPATYPFAKVYYRDRLQVGVVPKRRGRSARHRQARRLRPRSAVAAFQGRLP